MTELLECLEINNTCLLTMKQLAKVIRETLPGRFDIFLGNKASSMLFASNDGSCLHEVTAVIFGPAEQGIKSGAPCLTQMSAVVAFGFCFAARKIN